MKLLLPRILTVLAALSVTFDAAAAEQTTAGTGTERVLILGDSWAELTWSSGALADSLAWRGHGDKEVVGQQTALGGTTAADWNLPAYRQRIQQELTAYPTIDVIHLSIGGNDFLGAWSTGMSAAEEQALFDTIADDVESIIAYLHSLDPDLEVVYGSYDYINLEEIRGSNIFAWLLWLGLGTPTPIEVNTAMAQSSSTVFRRIASNPKVHLLNHSGAMQFFFGYPAHGIAPRSLPLPGNEPEGWVPGLGGNPTLPSPPAAMLDGIHLTADGYRIITRHAVYRFYDAYFDANP